MQRKVMTARPAARKGSGNDKKVKKTVAVASSRHLNTAEPVIQMVERRSSPNLMAELPKKTGELPVPTATFVF